MPFQNEKEMVQKQQVVTAELGLKCNKSYICYNSLKICICYNSKSTNKKIEKCYSHEKQYCYFLDVNTLS